MNKRKSIPDIRFPDFNIDWDFRRLGDEVEFFSGLTYSPDNIVKKNGTFVLRSSNVKNGEIIETDNVYVENEAVNSINVQVGDIIVVVRNGSRSLIGKHATIKKTMKNTVIGAFMTGIHSEHSSFVNALLDTRQFEVEIHKNLGATINQITVGNFKKMEFFFPLNSEQEKIGSFFNKLDQTIVLQQQLLDNHKQLKKAMLQKMFPQKGESVPRIRFAGFDDVWEETYLKDISAYKNGKGHEKNQSEIGKYELINLNSISINGGLKPSGKFVNSADEILRKNDLVMILSDIGHGDLLGRTALIPEDNRFVLNQRVALLRPYESINSEFLLHCINNYQNYFKIKGAGMSQLNLSKSSVEMFLFLLPSFNEQIKIGNFFKQLDENIVLHEQKLETYQELKKAMLQKMFV